MERFLDWNFKEPSSMVDTTHVAIQRNEKIELDDYNRYYSQFYSPKHNCHCLKFQVVVNFTIGTKTRIVDVSAGFTGMTHDMTIARLNKSLRNTYCKIVLVILLYWK